MKRFALFLAFSLFYFSCLTAQAKQEKWHKGIIFLNENEALKGEISFDQELNLVQLKAGEKVKVFSPLQVKLFQFYDTESGSNRVFTTIPEVKAGNFHKKKFFEVVLTGNITVLRTHQHTAIEQVPISINEAPLIRTRQFGYAEVVRHDYFILHNNKLKKLDNFKKDVLPLVGLSKKEFKHFLAENKMTLKNRKDQIKLIDHFNKEDKMISLSLH